MTAKNNTGAVFAFVHDGTEFYRPCLNNKVLDGPVYPSWQQAEYEVKRQALRISSEEESKNQLIKQLGGAAQIMLRTLDSIYAGADAKKAWLNSPRRKAAAQALKEAGLDDPKRHSVMSSTNNTKEARRPATMFIMQISGSLNGNTDKEEKRIIANALRKLADTVEQRESELRGEHSVITDYFHDKELMTMLQRY